MGTVQAKANLFQATPFGMSLLRSFQRQVDLKRAEREQAKCVSPKVQNLMRHVRQMLRIDESNVGQSVELFGEDGLAFTLKQKGEWKWLVCVDEDGTVAFGTVNMNTAAIHYQKVNLNASEDVAKLKEVAGYVTARPELKLVGIEN